MKKILAIIFLCLIVTNSNAQIAVIANKSIPLEKISKTKLLDIYSGDIKWWDNGDPVVVFDLAQKTEVKSTFYAYLGKSTSRMKSIIEINPRKHFKINIAAIQKRIPAIDEAGRSVYHSEINDMPKPDDVISERDIITLIGGKKVIHEFVENLLTPKNL